MPHVPGGAARRRGAYIAYSGEAMPCCMVATPDRANFGDMARHGVDPIWNAVYRGVF